MLSWIRNTRWVPESLLAAALLLFFGGIDVLIHRPTALFPALVFAVAVWVFRLYHWFTPLLIVLGTTVQIWLQVYPAVSSLLVFVAVFLQAAFGSILLRRITLLTAQLASATWVWFAIFESPLTKLVYQVQVRWFLFVVVSLFLITLLTLVGSSGRLANMNATHVGTDADKARMLHTQAKLGLEVAKQTERLSIARDLSELLVQRISAVVSLSEGGSFAARTQPESAGRVIEKVLDSARSAQVELRRLYDMLHEDHPLGAAPPKLNELDDVVKAMRSLGYNAKIGVDGTAYEIDEGAELCIFKIVLESLENVKKHTPLGTDVTVDFFWTTDGLQVLIKDNGIEVTRKQMAPQLADLSAGYTQEDDFNALVERIEGATLSVLNERAAVYEGSVEATRVPGVGFTISALFPRLRVVAGTE